MRTQALFVNGTVGVGKSATADALGALLIDRGVPHAIIDLDALRAGWPAPAGDPFNNALELVNLRAVAANHLAAGARILVLAGVIEDAAAVRHYEDAVGGLPLTVIRLTVDPRVGEARLRVRHRGDAQGLAWHLHRHGELDAVLDAAGIPGPSVDTTTAAPGQVAEAILALVG